MKTNAVKRIFQKRLKYIIPTGIVVIGIVAVSLAVFSNNQNRELAKSEPATDTSEQSSLTVTNYPNQSTISIEQNNQQILIFGQMTVDNLIENINLRRNYKGFKTLTSNPNLSKAAESIINNQLIGTDNIKFSQLMKNSGYKYAFVSSSIFTSCNDLTCALSSLEYSDTDKGIYSSVIEDIGIAVSSNQNHAVIIWGQPNQQVTSNYFSESSSSNSSSNSGSTFVLPDWSYKYTPPPDIDYSRPSPTLDTGSSTSTNSCAFVTSAEPNKYYYKCGYGQRATGVNCKAIAPYNYTSNLWSCNK